MKHSGCSQKIPAVCTYISKFELYGRDSEILVNISSQYSNIVMTNLKQEKSAGIDRIPSYVLKR